MKHTITRLVACSVLCMHMFFYPVLRIQNRGAVANATVTRFDPCSGTFFIGLDVIGTNQAFLRYVIRNGSDEQPYAQSVGQSVLNSDITVTQAKVLAITPPTTCNPLAVFTADITGTTVYLSDRCNVQDQSEELADAQCNSALTSIAALAASDCYALAAVRPNNSGNFGAIGSGIARLLIEKNPLQLCITDAQTGGLGNCAFPLDLSSDVLTGGTNNVTFIANDQNRVIMTYDHILCRTFIGVQIQSGATNGDLAKSVVIAASNPSGSEPLSLQTILPNNGAIDPNANEIIVGQTTDGRPVSLHTLALEVLHASTGPCYLIVAGGREVANACDIGNTIYALPLVNNPADTVTHATLANKNAPLVNGRFVTPATAPGQLANTTDPAAVVGAGPLPFNPNMDDTVRTMSAIQVVGDAVYASVAGPCTEGNDAGLFVSHAQFDTNGKIMGWTPWSLRAFPAHGFKTIDLNATSQTDLCQSNTPIECNNSKAISFFAVDAHNGQVWAIQATNSEDATAPKNIPNIGQEYAITTAIDAALVRTNWSIGSSRGTDLLSRLQQTALKCGSCSVLDLDQSTPQFACDTANRYILFGGRETVVFARTSIGQALADTLSTMNPLGRPQTIINRFDVPENFLETSLPSGSGPVCALAYSATTGPHNYFFAGTPTGLYVWSPGGSGFETGALGALNAPPFSDGLWTRAPNISGAVVDIQSEGNVLYVLTKEQDERTNLVSTVVRIPFAPTISAMFDSTAIETIAQSGVGTLDSVSSINKIALFTTNTLGTTEQLALATSNGLYCSVSMMGTQALGSAVSWMSVPDGGGIYTIIAQSPGTSAYVPTCSGLATPTCAGMTGPTGLSPLLGQAASRQTTIWPVGITTARLSTATQLTSVIRQLIRSSNQTPCTLIPNPFIAQITAPNSGTCIICPTLNAVDDLCCTLAQATIQQSQNRPITANASLFLIKQWWSDGGRRLGVTQTQSSCEQQSHAQLFALPYQLYRWGFSTLSDGYITHPLLNKLTAIYWISYSGAYGMLLLGTDRGVIGLA